MCTIVRVGTDGEWAAVLRDRRRALGLSQQELADLAGVSRRSVTAVETGKPTVRLDVLLALAHALGLALALGPPSHLVAAQVREGGGG